MLVPRLAPVLHFLKRKFFMEETVQFFLQSIYRMMEERKQDQLNQVCHPLYGLGVLKQIPTYFLSNCHVNWWPLYKSYEVSLHRWGFTLVLSCNARGLICTFAEETRLPTAASKCRGNWRLSFDNRQWKAWVWENVSYLYVIHMAPFVLSLVTAKYKTFCDWSCAKTYQPKGNMATNICRWVFDGLEFPRNKLFICIKC